MLTIDSYFVNVYFQLLSHVSEEREDDEPAKDAGGTITQ